MPHTIALFKDQSRLQENPQNKTKTKQKQTQTKNNKNQETCLHHIQIVCNVIR